MTASTTFCVYELPRLLFVDERLVLNPIEHILTCVVNGRFAAQALLTEQEQRVLLAFFASYPYPCPYLSLYSAVTEMPSERIELFFWNLSDEVSALAAEIARPVLQRCRALLDPFNLGIRPIEDVGYELFRL